VRRNLQLIRLHPVSTLPPLDIFRLQPASDEPLLKALAATEFKTLYARHDERRKALAARQ